MNEVAAVILQGLSSEAVSTCSSIPLDAAECLQELNGLQHIEPDVFVMFEKVMNCGLIEVFNPIENQQEDLSVQKLVSIPDPLRMRYNRDDLDKSGILRRCKRVFDYLLEVDPDLYYHLEDKQIEPHLFLL